MPAFILYNSPLYRGGRQEWKGNESFQISRGVQAVLKIVNFSCLAVF